MRLLRQANGLIGGATLAFFVALALVGVFYTPFDPLAIDLGQRLQPPSAEHWLGTDRYGRDLFSRIAAASRISLGVSAAVVVIATLGGVLLGAAAGYLGGLADRLIMVLLEAIMAFPGLLLVLVFLSVIGPSTWGVIVALGLAFLPTCARVVRSTVLSLRRKEFVEASRVLGNGDGWTVWRHVLPNTVSPVTVIATSLFASALLLESALSFLGLGVPPPAATWGGLLADSRQLLAQAPWLGIFPGLAISLALLGINLLGDALRDLLDPHSLEEG